MSRRGLTGLVVVVAALLVAGVAPAAPKPVPGEQAALTAVRKAAAAGRIDAASAAADGREVARAVHLARVLAPERRGYIETALEQVGALSGRLTAPRAVAVFGQLRANDDWFSAHPAPAASTDITDSDGIVYRFFAGRCFEFHPLANFGALNDDVAKKDVAATQRLADALVARGVARAGGGIAWEYYFDWDGGRPLWTSGMAQAVAAQAFARAALLVGAESTAFDAEARAAYLAIPGKLLTSVSTGPWIRLYSFSGIPVLNAQLQALVSLQSYAANTNDPAAAALAAQMQRAAAETLPRFDTGYWTYYSLAGEQSPLSYQKYVIQLLRKLAPADARFGAEATQFADYLRQLPAFQVADAPAGEVRFWLSKPAWVTVAEGGGATLRLSLVGGWHTLRLGGPKRAGIYGVHVTAVDPAGNRASFTALPLVRVAPPARASVRKPAGSGAPAAATPAFTVGAGIDDPAQAAQALPLRLGLVRMTIPWQAGETSPDPAVAASLQSLPQRVGLVLELDAAQLPANDADDADLAQYGASLAQEAPTLRDIVLTPGPVLTRAAPYADALAAVRAAVEEVRPDVAVGPSVDGSVAQPQQTVLALGAELAHDGAKADVVAFRPAAVAGTGAWASGAVWLLRAALEKELGAAPPVLLDGIATPSTVPSSELGGYGAAAPPTAGAVSPAAQAAAYTAAIGSASCSAGVVGLLLDRLVDGAASQPATGLFYAGGDAKPSAAAVAHELGAAGRGAVVCPGQAVRVTPTGLAFPEQIEAGVPASAAVGCDRDCLYLVALVRSNGRPIAAAHGALEGGYPAHAITLPTRHLAQGRYRIDVRLVSRVNPGAVTRRTSPWSTVG